MVMHVENGVYSMTQLLVIAGHIKSHLSFNNANTFSTFCTYPAVSLEIYCISS